MWGTQVTEHDLGTPLVCGFLPNLIDIFGTGCCFAVFIVRQHGIHEPLIQRQLSPIAGNIEHVVLGGVHHLVPYPVCPVRKLLHHGLLQFRWLQLLHMIVGLGHRQF